MVFFKRLLNSHAIPEEVKKNALERIETLDIDRVKKGIKYCQDMIRDRNNAVKRAGGLKGVYSHLSEYAKQYLQKGTPAEKGFWFLLQEIERYCSIDIETIPTDISNKAAYLADKYSSGAMLTDDDRLNSQIKRREKVKKQIDKLTWLLDSGVQIAETKPYEITVSKKTIKRHLSPAQWEKYTGMINGRNAASNCRGESDAKAG